jgi:hypothetical protein
VKKERKAFFIAASLLFATAFLGVAAQGSANSSNVVPTHPQQMASPSPAPT